MNSDIVILLGSVLASGVLLLIAIAVARSRKAPLDTAYYRKRMKEIEAQVRTAEAEGLHMAVLNADKLFDKALKERGYGGDTMGERLKRASKHLKEADAIWAAHKLRNRIAHEDKVNVNKKQALKAVIVFRKGLKELGAL